MFALQVSDILPEMSSSQQPRPKRAVERRHDRAKREEILDAATDRFGRDGYEDTKWADIAADVGVGPTALYHYFESKQHCLFVIMEEAIEQFLSSFVRVASENQDYAEALLAILTDCFALTEHEIQR